MIAVEKRLGKFGCRYEEVAQRKPELISPSRSREYIRGGKRG
nr:hypothetical protein [Methylobacterium nodulans]